uniref:K Homology domain-containing protein n=1 Tax=Ditylenchus dipsaci TaxID=166011 RepID=A0A915D5S9_9BILA
MHFQCKASFEVKQHLELQQFICVDQINDLKNAFPCFNSAELAASCKDEEYTEDTVVNYCSELKTAFECMNPIVVDECGEANFNVWKSVFGYFVSKAIIGKGGETVKAIGHKYNAIISVNDQNTPERSVSITAVPDAAVDCFQEILRLISQTFIFFPTMDE